MKLQAILASVAAYAHALPQSSTPNPHEWIPAGPNDFRGPCPMLNTLANHGFLPRNGLNITRSNAISALTSGLNFNATLGGFMWDQAIIANPEPNATFFTLEQLNVHNVLEHDASLSRADAALGNNHLFNATVFAESKKWWTSETISAEQLAHSKVYRQLESRATNPEYTFTASTEEFSLGEVCAPIVAFGDFGTASVSRDLVVYFFENERLPTELGWTKKKEEVTLQNILAMTSVMRNASTLLTGGETATENPHGRRDLHAGFAAALKYQD